MGKVSSERAFQEEQDKEGYSYWAVIDFKHFSLQLFFSGIKLILYYIGFRFTT